MSDVKMSIDLPSPRALAQTVVGASIRGLIANIVLAAAATSVWVVPDALIQEFSGALGAFGLAGASPVTVRLGVWTIAALMAAMFDLILSFHPMQHGADAFKDSTWFCKAMAAKILELDTRGAEVEKDWASKALQGMRMNSLLGFLVQFILGLPLYLIANLLPWGVAAWFLLADTGLHFNPLLVAWLFLIKLPGNALAITELLSVARRTRICER
jgi:hypothetical protein